MQQRKNLSTWRDAIKGIAILWVCFFHARLGLEAVPAVGAVYRTGYLGADMLVFLSGFGLYHSLQKPQTLKEYYTRRLKRLLPAYLPVCILWCLLMFPAMQLSPVQAIRSAVGGLTMLGYLADAPLCMNWYLSLILVTIVLAPVVHSFLQNSAKPRLTWFLLVLGACAIGLCYISNKQMMLVSRLPIFVLGMGFAMQPAAGERPKTTRLLYMLGFAAGAAMLWLCMTRFKELLVDYGMYWYPGLLMVPPLCVGLGWLFEKIAGAKPVLAVLNALGRASFEIFLFNVWFEVYCKKVAQYTQPHMYLLWMLASVALGLLWHWAVTLLAKKRKAAA